MADGICENHPNKGGTLYEWPGGRATGFLCSACVSALCEWCGTRDAVVSLGSSRDNWHACHECSLDVPKLSRKRRRVPLKGAQRD